MVYGQRGRSAINVRSEMIGMIVDEQEPAAKQKTIDELIRQFRELNRRTRTDAMAMEEIHQKLHELADSDALDEINRKLHALSDPDLSMVADSKQN